MKISVGILMGSDSDLATMEEAKKVLTELGVGSEIKICSAHRTPDMARRYAQSASKRGIKVIIAGAGMANHLAGAMAAHCILPVIGVPLEGSPFQGVDALLSTVQMPAGIPVACVAVGRAGAKNAAFLAVQILALADFALASKLKKHRTGLKKAVMKKNKKING